MIYQVCLHLKDSEKKRLDDIVQNAKISKVGIFRAGMEAVEKQMQKEPKK